MVEAIARRLIADGAAGALATRLVDEREERPRLFGPLTERKLNTFGYELLNASQTDEAIAVLDASAALFPESSNTWDSLGEALWRAGRGTEAGDHYPRSLRLDETNDHARRMIQRIREAGRDDSR